MADETNVLDQLISRVADETLRGRLAREVELLRGSRRFGLVFDRHLPESVRLVDHPIRRGVRVALRDETSEQTWTVERFTDPTREVAVLSGDGGDQFASDLVVVREFGEPIYPGLKSVERIPGGPDDAPWHVVINGENFHALQALRSTHRGKVDLIYIDPPYNTGNEGWIYNDRHVDQNDRAKSSKWLSFIERRLLIARDLLKSTGVIIVAIGDDEHHRLRMLMDQVFEPANFIANVVWNGSRKNDATFISTASDYMLFYANDAVSLAARGRWCEPKNWAEEVLEAGAEAWDVSGRDAEDATRRLKAWFRQQPRGKFTASQKHYRLIDNQGRVFSEADPGFPNGQGPRYDVLHPVTGLPCRVPERGWRFNQDVFETMIAEGRVHFRADHTSLPRPKTFLAEQLNEKAESVFYTSRKAAAQYVAKILGDKRFPFPKDHEVLMRWFRMAAPKDAVVLDFFGGSGTTTEAVMRLNAEDGGSRQSILVTNNEVGSREAKALRNAGNHPGDEEWDSRGVFEHVCRPRIKTVATGKRPDGSTFSDALPGNVEMFDLAYLDPSAVRRGQAFSSVAPLFWLEGGAAGERIETVPECGWALTNTYGVLFDIDALPAFSAALVSAATADRSPAVLFVITDSPAQYRQAVERLPVGVETVQLYEDYLSNYTINTSGAPR